MGVATTLAPQNRTKKWAHLVNLLVQRISRKSVFKIFRPEPPLNIREWPELGKKSDSDHFDFILTTYNSNLFVNLQFVSYKYIDMLIR